MRPSSCACRLARAGQKCGGRLAVGDRLELVTHVDQGGQRGQCALTLAGVMPETATLELGTHRPHRQLVGDDHSLVTTGRLPCGCDGPEHPCGDLFVGLPHEGLNGLISLSQCFGYLSEPSPTPKAVSYTHLRAHETDSYLVCRLLLE